MTSVDAEQPTSQQRRYRTGTFPYMALDLLNYLTPPQHLYRSDLESFFYVLVTFLATFNREKRKTGLIYSWLGADFQAVGMVKSAFVKNVNSVLALVDQGSATAFTTALRQRVRKVAGKVILKLASAYDQIGTEIQSSWVENLEDSNAASMQEKIDACWADVHPLVVARENILTYKTFMACLGEEVGYDD